MAAFFVEWVLFDGYETTYSLLNESTGFIFAAVRAG